MNADGSKEAWDADMERKAFLSKEERFSIFFSIDNGRLCRAVHRAG